MRKTVFLWFAALVLFLTACSNSIQYSRFSPISSEEWHMDSLAQFVYSIEDTASDYQMLIYVRHTEQYPYQNMWLFVDDSGRRDTIEFYLADDRSMAGKETQRFHRDACSARRNKAFFGYRCLYDAYLAWHER